MKIVILCIGTYGDVEPIIVLGKELAERGYSITIASHQTFEKVIKSYGLNYYFLPGDIKELLASEYGQEFISSKNLASAYSLIKMFKSVFKDLLQGSWNACKDADAIIYSSLSWSIAECISEKLGIPKIGVFLQPVNLTEEFSSLLIHNRKNYSKIFNKISWKISDLIFWLPFKHILNDFRSNVLQIPPIQKSLFYFESTIKKGLIIYAISPSVLKRPKDWKGNIHMTGNLFLEKKSSFIPSQEILNFISKGASPIYIGFGSALKKNIDQIFKVFSEALEQNNQRGLFVLGWSSTKAKLNGQHLLLEHAVPHDWLFPFMKFVIHHGGAGTTAAGLKAGKPTIIMPHDLDQFFWGDLVYSLGLGPKPLNQLNLTVNTVSDKIREVLTNANYERNALELSRKIEQEQGDKKVGDIIDKFLESKKALIL
jgi:sterol 3beta-glucosyltransferase